MRKILIIVLFLPFMIIGQQDRPPQHFQKKLDELEKIKLIEILSLDDETMLKFLNRRKEYNDKIRDLFEQVVSKTEQLEKALDNESDSNIKNLVSDIIKTEDNISKTRQNYFHSLSDILDDRQIAKLLVFEKNFRKEMRDIIFKDKKRKPE